MRTKPTRSALRALLHTLGRGAVALCASMAAAPLQAQSEQGRGAPTWDDFVAEYREEEDETEGAQAAWEELEALHAQPLNLNTATRADLLRLPFLAEAQADSILAYRAQRRGFLTLGELQLVRGLERSERRWLQLFVYAGDTLTARPKWRDDLSRGRHQLETRLDVPLQWRAGYRSDGDGEPAYAGNALAHTLRYRFRSPRGVAWGLTLQKDAGEPCLRRGYYPYDYVSAYVARLGRSGRWAWVAGDYNVSMGQGLLFGSGYYASRSAAVESRAGRRTALRPHTSTDEANFLRGLALTWRPQRRWAVTLFASHRRLDARLEGDTARTLYTDGLHRTESEMAHRRQLGSTTLGALVGYDAPAWTAGLGGYATLYAHPVGPEPRPYNRHYLRGRTAAGATAHYAWSLGRWSAQGEVAADRRGHVATTHRLRYEALEDLALTLQGRYFSPRYVAPHAVTLQQASRVQNEAGLLVGLSTSLLPRQTWTAYVDLFRFPATTFRADGPSQGMEANVEGRFHVGRSLTLGTRYRLRARQQNVAATDGLLQYVWTHRLRLYADLVAARVRLRLAADASAARSQTSPTEWGCMLSARLAAKLHRRLSASAFAAIFRTDSYDVRLFAYEPQLRYAGAFPSFAYKGFRLVAMADWQLADWVALGGRAAWMHYFDRSTIGSGAQRIDGPDQADVAVQLRLEL